MLIKKSLITIIFLLSVSSLFSKERIAPYILDGSLVLYFPNIAQVSRSLRVIIAKTQGREAENTLARLQFRLQEKMSVDIFTQEGSDTLGIDYNGGVAYVYLNSEVSYAVFTVRNKNILQNQLDNLAIPIPYRLEEDFVIFSASQEILDYYDFKGITHLEEFKKIEQILNLNWDKNIIWMDSSYFKNRNFFPNATFVKEDRIGGTFNITDNTIEFDLFTFYDDPEINRLIQDSTKVSPVQKITFLDYESGTPGIVGHTYINIPSFLQLLKAIDQSDYLSLIPLLEKLIANDIDIDKDIMPYLKGRLSYVIRAFDLTKNELSFTLSSEINNKRILSKNLKNIVRSVEKKGITTIYKNLFTQQFYGWKFDDLTLWVGIVEDHLIISTDEVNLLNLVQNIYQAESGFLNTLPISFRRLVNNKVIGGQMLLRNPYFVQTFNLLDSSIHKDFLLSFQMLEWNFYLINTPNNIGRRDIVIFHFYK